MWVVILVFLYAWIPDFSVAEEYAPISVEMKLQRVSKHVYLAEGVAGIATDNEGFISNAGVVVTEQGVVIFDALGTPSLAYRLLQEIRKVTSKPITRVIVSHYHADHIYGLEVFEDLGAEIWAPFGSEDYLRSPVAAERLEERSFSLDPWVKETTRLVEPDHYVDRPESFQLGGVKFTLTMVGAAHSTGDLTMFVEPDGVLFSGDIVFEGRIPYMGDANSGHWLAVLKRIQGTKLAALVPGHGAVAQNPKKVIRGMSSYLKYLRDMMGAAVDDLVPFDEVYNEIDWSAFEKLPAFEDANRQNAYQVYLSMEAESLD